MTEEERMAWYEEELNWEIAMGYRDERGHALVAHL